MELPTSEPIILHAGAVCDAAGIDLRPGSLALHQGAVLAVGEPAQVQRALGADLHRVDMPDMLLVPAMINAHAHLDLTRVGPLPPPRQFDAWLRQVTQARPIAAADVADSILQGVRLSTSGGVAAIGDIVGSLAAVTARRDTGLPGVSYLETFGIGAVEQKYRPMVEDAVARRHELTGDIPLGLSPHAPYTCSLSTYQWLHDLALQHDLPLCTHLAETPEEIAFVRDAAGPYVDHLKHFGAWSDDIRGHGMHPVELLAPLLRTGRWLLAHCNYVEDHHIDLLAQSGAAVAYCPIASEYFGHRDHRYRDMLQAGVTVALGTDSIVCQPADEPQPLGILPAMRRLYRRDAVDVISLLAMATLHGTKALGMDPGLATLSPGPVLGVHGERFDAADARHPLVQVLARHK